MNWIHGLVRETLRGRAAAVSAREAARRVCPAAGLRIRLEADASERAVRKRRQLLASGVRGIFVDDASLIGPSDGVHAVVDTTGLHVNEVAQRVFRMVDSHLQWSYMPPSSLRELDAGDDPNPKGAVSRAARRVS